LDFFSIHINGMSTTGSRNIETIGHFTVNAPSAPTFVFSSIYFTYWDGVTVTTDALNGNGEFRLDISAARGESFNTITFFHFQASAPNGSSIRDIEYHLAGTRPDVVPIPGAIFLFGGGLAVFGLLGSRRKRSVPPSISACG
jgi:hypothetical protein